MVLKVGSLFAGIGGIDLAFQQAGCKVVWAIEKDAACCQTYWHNFLDTRLCEADIQTVNPQSFSAIDILVAGFPCQPFSVAGKQLGFADIRGTLFYEIARFAKELQPQCIFLENVPNLMEHDEGRTFLVIHNVLSELGYFVRYQVMRASEYGGIPQIRDRIYIVAFKDIKLCDHFSYPEKIELALGIETILRRNQKKDDAYYLGTDAFGQFASKIVTRKNCIYRVYHESIKPTANQMCPTLTASMGMRSNQVHLVRDDFGVRRLTIRECLEFQGFLRTFSFPKTITLKDAYKQCGNTVVVPVVKRIAQKICDVIDYYDLEDE